MAERKLRPRQYWKGKFFLALELERRLRTQIESCHSPQENRQPPFKREFC
jgi:hypothetical protein